MGGDDPRLDYLQKSTRRRILSVSAGAVVSGFAGCVSDQSDDPEPTKTDTQTPPDTPVPTASPTPVHEFKSPPYENVETEESASSTSVFGEIVLAEGQYAQREFRLEEPTQIQITGINEGEGSMDLFLLHPESKFARYQEGESAIFSGGLAETNVESIEQSLDVSPGRYFLVFDNSAVYGAEPQGTVRFEFRVELGTGTRTPTETETETPTETSPSQPKIREVQDNFGHTFSFRRESVDSVRVDDEIVVSDDTVIELCVTEVAKQEGDTITYSYDFLGDAAHPDNPESATTRIENNCWSWDMRRTDYKSDWGFRIWVRNEDEIYYQNDSVESDFSANVYYTNLTLAE